MSSVVLFAIVAVLVAGCSDTTEPADNVNAQPPHQYDALQQLYLNINPDMSYEEVLQVVKSSKLPYDYSGGAGYPHLKVAFDDEVAVAANWAKRGDYVDISFDAPLSNTTTFSVLTYYNMTTDITILQYEKGAYYMLYDVDEKYKGLYINDYNIDDKFEVTRTDGTKSDMDHFKLVNSKEEQFQHIDTRLKNL